MATIVDLRQEIMNPTTGNPVTKVALMRQVIALGMKVQYQGTGNTRRALISKEDAEKLRGYYEIKFSGKKR